MEGGLSHLRNSAWPNNSVKKICFLEINKYTIAKLKIYSTFIIAQLLKWLKLNLIIITHHHLIYCYGNSELQLQFLAAIATWQNDNEITSQLALYRVITIENYDAQMWLKSAIIDKLFWNWDLQYFIILYLPKWFSYVQ